MAEIFDVALNYLSFCSRTEKEVRTYLNKKGFESKKIKETIEKLKDYKYINDKAYVKTYTEFNKTGNRYGKERVKFDLKKKGISKDDLELIDGLISEEDEDEFIKFHFQKALKRTEGSPYSKRQGRIMSYLVRRGFRRNSFENYIRKIPKDDKVDEEEFLKHLNHYVKLYNRKGYSGYELKNRIIKAMLSRGYDYELIKENLSEILESDF